MRLFRGGIILAAAAAAAASLLAWQVPSKALAAPGSPNPVAGHAAVVAATSPSPSPSPVPSSPSPSGTPSPGAPPSDLPTPPPESCNVTYSPQDYGDGTFRAEVTIANYSQSYNIAPWELTWTFSGDQHVTSIWNVNYSQSGENVVTWPANNPYNGEISPNSAIDFIVYGTYTNSDASPYSFLLNGIACT